MKKFQCGGVNVAIWENEIETANGPQTVERVTIERRYKDEKDGGAWKSTNSYRMNELPKAILVLQKAYEALACKKRSDDDGDGQE